MPILDHFNILAPLYDRLIHFEKPERLARIAALPMSGRLLDAGGGTGRVAYALAEYATQVVVADQSMGMLQQAAMKGGVQPVCAITEQLPFPDGMFERIIIVDAMHHVYDAVRTSHELWRVLKPGGRIVIEEPDIRKGIVKLAALVEKAALMRSHFISPIKLASYFTSPHASINIMVEGYTAWVVVDKVK